MSASGEDPSLSRERARRALAWLLALCVVVYAVPLWWGLPSDKSWSFDEIRPSQVVEPFQWPDKYPPLHRHLLSALLAPVALLAAALGLGPESPRVYAVLYLLSRMLSVVLATGTVYLVYRSGRLLFDRTTSLLAAASAAFVPPFVYYAKTANLEAPYLFWFAASLLFYLKALRGHRLRDYLAFSTTAVFSMCTKDQAYGLYLLLPLALVAALARRKWRRRPRPAALLSALFDCRPLAALGLAFFWFTLIYQGGLWGEEFWEHLRRMTSYRMVGQYRLYPGTLSGQLEMALHSLAQSWVAFTPPLLVGSLVGLAAALRRPASVGGLLSLLLVPTSYYASFIAVIGYDYARFFLPVYLVLSFFAARGLAAVMRTSRLHVVLRGGVVAAGLAYPLTWAVALDLSMLGDARYAVEKWLREEQAAAKAVGVGRQKMLPRGIATIEWMRLHKNRCARLRSLDAELLIVNPREPAPGHEAEALRRLERGVYGYRESKRFRNRFPLRLFEDERVLWNLDKIAQEIVALERTDGECFDARTILRRIGELQRGSQSIDRKRLARVILDEGVIGTLPLDGPAVQAVGLTRDHWTRGTQAAALAVRGDPLEAVRHSVRVALPDGKAPFPVTVFVQDDAGVEAIELAAPGQKKIELPEVPAHSSALFLIWTDSAWSPGPQDRRQLGVRLLPVRDPS